MRVPAVLERNSSRLALIPILALALPLSWGAAGLYYNTTGSLPLGIYQRSGRAAEAVRGDIVLTCVPAAVGRLALQRGYLAPGDCPGGTVPIGKPIAAVAGDTILHLPQEVRVNGRPLPNSRTQLRDTRGAPLPTAAWGAHVLTAGEVWLESSYHWRSFDSRYFGPVSRSALRARLRPVLTW